CDLKTWTDNEVERIFRRRDQDVRTLLGNLGRPQAGQHAFTKPRQTRQHRHGAESDAAGDQPLDRARLNLAHRNGDEFAVHAITSSSVQPSASASAMSPYSHGTCPPRTERVTWDNDLTTRSACSSPGSSLSGST